MRRPYSQPLRLGKYLSRRLARYGLVWQMDRYRGLRLLAAGPTPVTLCDWVHILLASGDTRVKKPTKLDTPDGGAPPHGKGGAGLGKCPKVIEWLTAPSYEDGSPRKGGWLGLSAEAGVFRALMKEPSAGLLMRVEIASLDMLWPTLEIVLSEKVVPWQPDPRAEVPKPRKRGGGA